MNKSKLNYGAMPMNSVLFCSKLWWRAN